jgi:hypothetical protein
LFNFSRCCVFLSHGDSPRGKKCFQHGKLAPPANPRVRTLARRCAVVETTYYLVLNSPGNNPTHFRCLHTPHSTSRPFGRGSYPLRIGTPPSDSAQGFRQKLPLWRSKRLYS